MKLLLQILQTGQTTNKLLEKLNNNLLYTNWINVITIIVNIITMIIIVWLVK